MKRKINLIFNKDCDSNLLRNKNIGIIGFGNQGSAQTLNLIDRNLNVKVGIRNNSKNINKLEKYNIKYDSIVNIVKWADIISILVPDKAIAQVYNKNVRKYLKPGKTLLFSHGFNIHYKLIIPPENINVIMVAPSGGGKVLRDEFIKGSGIPSLIAVHNDFSGDSLEIVKAYSRAIGSTRICSFISTFKEETETDLFGEQVLLTGGIPYIINKSLKVLLEDGYSPEVAWFVCYYEIKTIVDLFHKNGFDFLFNAISDTARYGGITRGKYLIDKDFENKIKKILNDIKNGNFVKELNNNKNEIKYNNELDDSYSGIFKDLLKTINRGGNEN